ncbi:hypothetical protein SDRG_07927 [Saprolegnia diclina VS20]|uniref:PGAP2IP C-terminal nuclease-like domain-containing protein n=1 Tax=Saprolegnia diclina (strain VS20) TaxID=1156394 RepID=T0Q9N3_SAPDV|nr:hypothetical protein SDRG_07927 [Saprolegnia diclina VS20]EQC34604.1 hypothetical protein SDRG_07927 [Saprolegnia diclina VS20]|eukprot:XP_008612010.1 hypothetical protein SDRG_07927 [Saprolegnia diclina VS20]
MLLKDVGGRDGLLLAAHTGAGVVLWSLVSALPRDIYWFSLDAMGLPSQVVYLSILLTCPPVCLMTHTLRVYCAKGYGVGVSLGSLCLLSRHLDASPETHLVTACVGLTAMLTVSLALWSSETSVVSIDGSVTLPAMALHGLVLGNALFLWLRSAGLSLNPLLDLPGSGFSCIPLALLCGVLLHTYRYHWHPAKVATTASAAPWRRVLGFVGLSSLFFFTHWLFTAPTAIPRWLGVHHAWGWLVLVTYTLGVLCAPLGGAVAAATLFGAGAIAFHASSFPGLSLCGAAAMGLALPSLWLLLVPGTLMASPEIGAPLDPVAPERLCSDHELGVATPRRCSCSVMLSFGAFLLSLVYTLLVALTIALTTYDYLPAELRGFRGQRFRIFYATVSVICGAVLVLRPLTPTLRSTMDRLRFVVGAGLCCVCAVPMASFYAASSVSPGANPPPVRLGNVTSDLRLVSFNVYQGFNRAGGNNFNAIRSMLDDFNPHIVALQESDTMQTGSGSLDLALYLALHRGMYSFASPATDADSFGCTLLSSFPILAATGIVLPSQGENACFQHVQLNVRGTPLHVMNVHLGNDGTTDRDTQLALVLAHVRNASGPLVLMGDFNTRKGSRAYASLVQSTQLLDAGDRGNCVRPSPHPNTGVPIEYIFFSNVTCVQFEYPQRYSQQQTADSFPRVAYMNLTST